MSGRQSASDLETAPTDPEGNRQDHRENKTTTDQLNQDPNVVDWDGPDDPATPLNWPSFKRNFHVIIVSIFTLYA
jgi:hypothetical protein